MQRLRPTADCVGNQVAIKCGKLSAVRVSEGEEVSVRHLAGVEQPTAVNSLVVEET
jgi:hypothetical protein